MEVSNWSVETGAICPKSGWWHVPGDESSRVSLSKDQIMPIYRNGDVQWVYLKDKNILSHLMMKIGVGLAN